MTSDHSLVQTFESLASIISETKVICRQGADLLVKQPILRELEYVGRADAVSESACGKPVSLPMNPLRDHISVAHRCCLPE